MRAAVFRSEGVVETAEMPEPELQEPTDAIVRVTRAGICGSDLHFLHAKAPLLPGSIMGHEAVGTVERVGDAVTAVRPGERVVASFHIACGQCWFCRRGETGLCDEHRILGAGPFGGDLVGAQAQYVRIPVADVNLLPVPDMVEDERALFVGDVLTTGVYAASLAGAEPGETVAVIGAGPVGYCTAIALRAAGMDEVVVVDRDETRLALAAAVGAPDAYELAIESVRRGGRVVVVGMYAGETVELQLGVAWARGLRLVFAGETPVHTWWHRAMAGLADGTLDPLPLVSHRLPLSEAAAGYAAFERREATKVVLDPWA